MNYSWSILMFYEELVEWCVICKFELTSHPPFNENIRATSLTDDIIKYNYNRYDN